MISKIYDQVKHYHQLKKSLENRWYTSLMWGLRQKHIDLFWPKRGGLHLASCTACLRGNLIPVQREGCLRHATYFVKLEKTLTSSSKWNIWTLASPFHWVSVDAELLLQCGWSPRCRDLNNSNTNYTNRSATLDPWKLCRMTMNYWTPKFILPRRHENGSIWKQATKS